MENKESVENLGNTESIVIIGNTVNIKNDLPPFLV